MPSAVVLSILFHAGLFMLAVVVEGDLIEPLSTRIHPFYLCDITH